MIWESDWPLRRVAELAWTTDYELATSWGRRVGQTAASKRLALRCEGYRQAVKEPTDYQAAVLDGLLRAEENGVPYPYLSVARPTRAVIEREGWTGFPHPFDTRKVLTDSGRGLAVGYRLGMKTRRRCA